MRKQNTSVLLAHIISSGKRLTHWKETNRRKSQRISLGVLVQTHLIHLPCAGFNQLIQFSFFMSEICYLQRQGTILSSSVQKKKKQNRNTSSHKFWVRNLTLNFKPDHWFEKWKTGRTENNSYSQPLKMVFWCLPGQCDPFQHVSDIIESSFRDT